MKTYTLSILKLVNNKTTIESGLNLINFVSALDIAETLGKVGVPLDKEKIVLIGEKFPE